MNIFSRLFKKKPVVEIADPVFGNLSYENGVWIYSPKSATEGFMITVDAPESGPTESQRGLFKRIHSNLPELEQRARDYLRPHVDIGVDVSDLSIYSVEIGPETQDPNDNFVLEMSDEDAAIIHRIRFSGKDTVDYELDD